jgi:hypothetical protein
MVNADELGQALVEAEHRVLKIQTNVNRQPSLQMTVTDLRSTGGCTTSAC